MDIKEVLGKVNGVFAWLPFVKLAGKIPSGILGKIPVLNTVIPFANHAAVVLLIVVLAACFGGGGKSNSGSGGASAVPANAVTNSPTDFSYELTEDGNSVRITEYIGPHPYDDETPLKFVIPAVIEGYPVTEINIGVTAGNVVVIPDTVTKISGGITAPGVKLPAGLIEMNAYLDTPTVELPVGLKKIGDGDLYNGLFSHELTSITIPNTVTEIGREAFAGTALTSIVIPDSVTSLGLWAFDNCYALTEIRFSDNLIGIDDLCVNGGFRDKYKLKKINLPKNLQYINYEAFFGFPELLEIEIPDTLTSVEFDGIFSTNSDYGPDPRWFTGRQLSVDHDGGSAFSGTGNGRLPLRTRQRLQELGYKGEF